MAWRPRGRATWRARGRAAGSGGEVHPCPLGCSSTPRQALWVSPRESPSCCWESGCWGECPSRSQPDTSVVDSISKRLPDSKYCPRESLCSVIVCPDLALGQQVQSPDADYRRLGPGCRGELSGSPCGYHPGPGPTHATWPQKLITVSPLGSAA